MPRALVVYESMFGNTKLIAEAIAAGLDEHLQVVLAEVSAAPAVIGPQTDLLVVGGPTHAFGLSKASTRRQAGGQTEGELVSKGVGIREWIEGLPTLAADVAAATFDTKIRKPNLPGSAASGAEKRLRKRGFRILLLAETFYVDGPDGPLTVGEQERARQHGVRLGAMAAARQPA